MQTKLLENLLQKRRILFLFRDADFLLFLNFFGLKEN